MELSDDDIAALYEGTDGLFIRSILQLAKCEQMFELPKTDNNRLVKESYCERCTVPTDPDGNVHVCVRHCEKLMSRNCDCIEEIRRYKNFKLLW